MLACNPAATPCPRTCGHVLNDWCCQCHVRVLQIVGECATVRDTWAQVTLPIPLGFTPPTDGVSNPAIATGNPPSLQQRVCVASNFAYVMTIPASQPSQRACGDWAVSVSADTLWERGGGGDAAAASVHSANLCLCLTTLALVPAQRACGGWTLSLSGCDGLIVLVLPPPLHGVA